MKSVSARLTDHYSSRETTMATALKFTRPDGTVFGFTSTDRLAVIGGVTYDPEQGLEVGQILTSSGGAVGNLELRTAHDGTLFKTDEILQGIWRNSTFELFRYNWNNLGDPYYSSVKALLHFNGADGSTTFIDEKGHTFTRQGTTEKISIAQKKFGTASYRQSVITGSSRIQAATSADWNLGSGDFTFEAWIYVESYSDGSNGGRGIACIRNTGADGIAFCVGSSGQLLLRASIGGSWNDNYMPTANGVIPLNRWTHVAWSRIGSAWKCFVNGKQKSTLTNAGVISFSSTPFTIGSAASVDEWRFLGWIDELRLTKGVDRYTSDFFVQDKAFVEPDITEKDVLLTGVMGEVTIKRNEVVVELRDLRQYLQQPLGSITSKTCRYRFGDARCGVDTRQYVIPATTAGDVYYPYNVLHLHGDGSDGAQVFPDSSSYARTVSFSGNAQIDTAQSKFGGASILFDGAGDKIYTADAAELDFGTADFTVELYARWNNFSNTYTIIGKRVNTGGFGPWLIMSDTSGNLYLYASSNGSSWDICNPAVFGTLSTATWYHIAISKKNKTWRLFLNGVRVNQFAALTNAVIANSAGVHIASDLNDVFMFNGWIDEVRLTNGIARYINDFTVPVAVFDDFRTLGSASVTSMTSNQIFTDLAQAQVSDYFGNGTLTWLTGLNVGVSVKIKAFASGQFALMLPMMNAIQVGDTYTATPGCRGRHIEDCKNKWNNILRFGGEPHRPKVDDLTKPGEA